MTQGIYTKNPRSIRTVLRRWIATQKEYIKKSDDYPWWYNERASTGILAAACWKSNNIALEEFSTIKGVQKGKVKRGRCDIYFSSGGEDFVGEAKQAWISSGSKIRKSIKGKLDDGLKNAKQSTIELQKQEGRRLAICFAVPYFPKADQNKLKNLIMKFIEALSRSNATSYAYYFITKNFEDCEGDDGRLYPGNAIIIKEIKRAKRV